MWVSRGALVKRWAVRHGREQIAEQSGVATEGDFGHGGVLANFEDLKLADVLYVNPQKSLFMLVNAFNCAALANNLKGLSFYNTLLWPLIQIVNVAVGKRTLLLFLLRA